MNTFLFVLLGLAVLGVVYVLGRGVISMANGKDMTGRTSNKYMSYRVGLQFLVVALVIVIALVARHHG